jgi:hypothetical protein
MTASKSRIPQDGSFDFNAASNFLDLCVLYIVVAGAIMEFALKKSKKSMYYNKL